MHEGCSGSFESGQAVITKLRTMGFSNREMPSPHDIACEGCGKTFTMATFEAKCPECGMVYGVTPCHSFDKGSIMAAGKE